jgi:hypothetical protein
VLLSLGLAALVMVAIATAIDVHLRCLQIGRTNVEEAQLARTLLLRIGDDLRNVAVLNPVDSTKIVTPSATSTAGADGEEENATTTTTTTTETEDEYVLGIYGESDWIQIDVRRAPRLDQYDYETLPGGSELLPDRVSGIKTVGYSLHEETGLTAAGGEYRGGLLRREIDHALTRWAEDTGSLTSADQELEPIAPEVIDLEFLYYDGTQWIDNWDSTEMGGLPIAVHVSMVIVPREQLKRFTRDWNDSSQQLDQSVDYVYSLTVALPVAEGDQSSDTTSEETTGSTEAEEMSQ